MPIFVYAENDDIQTNQIQGSSRWINERKFYWEKLKIIDWIFLYCRLDFQLVEMLLLVIRLLTSSVVI